MRVLFIVSNSRLGGAENLTLRLARGLKTVFPEVQFDCLLTHARGDLYTQYRNTFTELHNCFGLETEERMQRIVERMELGYGLVHSIDNLDMMAMLPEGCYPPILQNVFLDITLLKHEVLLRLLEQASRNYAAIVTEYGKNVAVMPVPSRPPSIVQQIPGGVDQDFWTPEGEKQNKICWVGRLTALKGALILADIIRLMPDTQFIVVANENNTSPGFLHNDFVALSKECSNLDYRWTLAPEDLREVYRSSRFYLHTSLSEAHPGTLMEAMSCGCVPLCGCVGGIPEILQDRVVMIDMEQPHLPSAFVEVLKSWKKMHYSDAQDLGEEMRQRIAEGFSLAQAVKKYANIYSSLLTIC